MQLTDYHAKYFAHELTKRCPSDGAEKLAGALVDAQVDLNPHQIEAALFAFKSPLSRGAMLADEVGLGKTIEAGLVLSQKWAERKRKALVITPSNLRKQWHQELQEKFFLPCRIIETKSYNDLIRKGDIHPLEGDDIVICSYQFARKKATEINQIRWDLVVIDEAHRLRNVYKPSNVIANTLKEALKDSPKLLLTATPLQNSLLELFGLLSFIDAHTFGDLKSFSSKEERSEMRAHYQGYLKFRVVSAVGAENGQFFEYVEMVSSRSKSKPLAYETVRKALFNNFLCLYETEVPIDVALDMRDRERDNFVILLRLFTEKVLASQFDLSKGIYKIEERLASDPSIRDPHLRAHRLCRQAPLIVIMRELRDALTQLLSLRGRYQDARWDKGQVLWANIEENDWKAVAKMLEVILSHKVWIERNEAYTRVLQDTRQKSWEEILVKGTLPGAATPVYEPLNHSVLLKYASGAVK